MMLLNAKWSLQKIEGKFKMHIYYRASLLLFIALISGCQLTSEPPSTKPDAVKLNINPKTMSFIHPGSGDLFSLHLGDDLIHDTGGITEVPKNIKIGFRDATSSYYEPRDENGCGYFCAESSWSKDNADRVADNTTIQYQADSGRLLITEDKSDASPCRRYILYTRHKGGGYTVSYLAPPPVDMSEYKNQPFSSLPSDVNLLPGDRAEINGKIVSIDNIPQSSRPFSTGG